MVTEHGASPILQRLKAGSEQAFGEVFQQYYRELAIVAFHLLKDEMEAEDLVQQLFIDIWDRELFSQLSGSVRSYLHRAVRNKCFDALDKKKTEQRRFSDFAREQVSIEEGNPLEQAEAASRVDAILGQLPEQRMRAFSLVYMEDKKYKEAAAEMGITVNSIKTHLKLAMKALQAKLEKL